MRRCPARSFRRRSGRCWSRAPTPLARSAMAGPIPRTRSARRPASPISKLVDDLGLVDNAGDVGAYFNRKMKEAVGDHPNVGDVRGEGMLCAVELVEDRTNRAFFDPGKKAGPSVVGAMLEARRHRPRHARGRHHRLRAAALPDAGTRPTPSSRRPRKRSRRSARRFSGRAFASPLRGGRRLASAARETGGGGNPPIAAVYTPTRISRASRCAVALLLRPPHKGEVGPRFRSRVSFKAGNRTLFQSPDFTTCSMRPGRASGSPSALPRRRFRPRPVAGRAARAHRAPAFRPARFGGTPRAPARQPQRLALQIVKRVGERVDPPAQGFRIDRLVRRKRRARDRRRRASRSRPAQPRMAVALERVEQREGGKVVCPILKPRSLADGPGHLSRP